jgi:predicted RNA methylase
VTVFVDSVNLRLAIKKMPGAQRLIDLSVVVEDWWFDWSRCVDTSSHFEEQRKRGLIEDCLNFHYVPIRPKCARRVLRNLPLKSPNEYTFIDFGSGKGRMLLLAARHGFQRVYGVELRAEFHEQASRNIRQYQKIARCKMESLHMDAADYEFPNQKLVLFFFNPFGNEVMAKVLENLSVSLDRCFREVWVVLHDPTSSLEADRTPQLRLEVARDGCRIYRSVRAAVPPAREASEGQPDATAVGSSLNREGPVRAG